MEFGAPVDRSASLGGLDREKSWKDVVASSFKSWADAEDCVRSVRDGWNGDVDVRGQA